jgi:peptidyl-prolyl cis-trans isomerase D
MAIISRIRSYGVISLAIGVLILLLFVLQSWLTGGNGFSIFGGASDKVGVINGESIKQDQWRAMLQEQSELFSYNNSQAHGLENDVWNSLIENTLLSPEYQSLGLMVTDEELDEILFGNFLSAYVKSTFYQGQDSLPFKEQMRESFKKMETDKPNLFTGYRKLVIEKRLKEKYDALVSAGAYVNSLDAKSLFHQANDKASIVYVVKPYAQIMESEISFSNDDIENYYNEHKNDRDFKQERSRTISYVRIPLVTSAADSAATLESLQTIATAFKASKTSKADSLFAVTNSGNPANAKVKYALGTFPEPFNSQVFSDSVGRVMGPFVSGGVARVVKLTSRGTEIDSVQARHILFKEKGASGKAKADSLKKVIQAKKNFAEMATKYSTDPGSAIKGGDLGMFARGAMVPEFDAACFNGKVGDLQIVESQFGTHLIEVTKKGSPKAVTYYAQVERPIAPSAATKKETYQKAVDFIQNHGDSASFRAGAVESYGGLTSSPNVRPEATAVSGVQSASDIIVWTYNPETKEGAISQPISVDDGIVVVCLMEIKEKGVPSLRNVYDRVKQEVIKEKKAEKYMAMMTGSSLEEIAGKVSGQVMTFETLSMAMRNIPSSGVQETESAAVGAAFGLPTGNISAPIQGKGGVYVIQRAADVTRVESPDNYVSFRKDKMRGQKSSAPMTLFNSLREAAEIEDYRFFPED